MVTKQTQHAARAWNKGVDEVLHDLGYNRLKVRTLRLHKIEFY